MTLAEFAEQVSDFLDRNWGDDVDETDLNFEDAVSLAWLEDSSVEEAAREYHRRVTPRELWGQLGL